MSPNRYYNYRPINIQQWFTVGWTFMLGRFRLDFHWSAGLGWVFIGQQVSRLEVHLSTGL